MKWVKRLSYAWSAITGLITLTVAINVINRFSEPFNRIAIDLLVLIYALMKTSAMGHALSIAGRAKTDRDRFLLLINTTGSTEYQPDVIKDKVSVEDDALNRNTMKIYIESCFVSLIYLVTLVNLFGAL